MSWYFTVRTTYKWKRGLMLCRRRSVRHSGRREKRRVLHAHALHARTAGRIGPIGAAPPVVCRVQKAEADIVHADPLSVEVVDVGLEGRWGTSRHGDVKYNIHRFGLDHVLLGDGPIDGEQAVDIDARWSGR